ncbi:hypothetical protein BT69DRAFT_1079286 [Atractiella rhizophila]|nr:hypothetical protein BT69DRAFT_1079286 [Atractiella rhizophila]
MAAMPSSLSRERVAKCQRIGLPCSTSKENQSCLELRLIKGSTKSSQHIAICHEERLTYTGCHPSYLN